MGDYNNPNDNNQSNQVDPNQQPYGQPTNQQPQYQQPYQNQNGYQQFDQNPYQNNQSPYQNNQYQYSQYQQYQTPPQSNGMAVASLICGILGVLLSCCLWYIAIPLAIAGLVLGIIVLKNKKGGKNLAIVGIILSAISIIVGIFVAILFIAVFTNPEFTTMYEEILREFETTY
jgi:uncharacterized membrane protein